MKSDRQRTSKPSASAISAKIFKYKRSSRPGTRTVSESKSVKSSTDGDVRERVRQTERKLSTPAFSTPTIVIDYAPPSAPVNGDVCSTSNMWDVLTTRRTDDDSRGEPVNGLIKHRFSFGRQKSNDKLIADTINDDWVLKIIRCFPFPSPKHSPKNSPPMPPKALPVTDSIECKLSAPTPVNISVTKQNFRFIRTKLSDPTNERGKYPCLGMMVRKTIETTFPPLIPWDVWLRKRLASWTQCSGHEGTVVPATEKTVWKKCVNDSNEAKVYRKLMDDAAAEIAPKFYKKVEHKGEWFLELEDLSRNFDNPCIMDIKMGTRTFLECEVQKECKRPDLYEKMVAIDPDEPTPDEHEEKAITKLRYMTFREQTSSTTSLGFRIDAAKLAGGVLQRDFQKVKTREQIVDVLSRFFGPNGEPRRRSLLARLRLMREKIEQSEFFQTHEVIGSSILIIHDSSKIGAWIIDFAKALPLENGKLDHRTSWRLGNREDGYLFGLDNLIEVVEAVQFDPNCGKHSSLTLGETQLDHSSPTYRTPVSCL